MQRIMLSELPPRITDPLGPERRFAGLPHRARRLAAAVCGEEPVYYVLRSRTRVDVGSWVGGSRVCLAALTDALALFAPSKHPLIGDQYAHLDEQLAEAQRRREARAETPAPVGAAAGGASPAEPDARPGRELAEEYAGETDPVGGPDSSEPHYDGRHWVKPDGNLRVGPPRVYYQVAPFTDLTESTYNHVTGQLVLAPDRRLRVAKLRVEPLEAYQVLAQIYRQEN